MAAPVVALAPAAVPAPAAIAALATLPTPAPAVVAPGRRGCGGGTLGRIVTQVLSGNVDFIDAVVNITKSAEHESDIPFSCFRYGNRTRYFDHMIPIWCATDGFLFRFGIVSPQIWQAAIKKLEDIATIDYRQGAHSNT